MCRKDFLVFGSEDSTFWFTQSKIALFGLTQLGIGPEMALLANALFLLGHLKQKNKSQCYESVVLK